MVSSLRAAQLIRSAQAIIGEEHGDDWGRLAFRVLYHDSNAVTRDLTDAVMEAREMRDRKGV